MKSSSTCTSKGNSCFSIPSSTVQPNLIDLQATIYSTGDKIYAQAINPVNYRLRASFVFSFKILNIHEYGVQSKMELLKFLNKKRGCPKDNLNC
ncbi:hypothetical protein [Flagellimonas onchidii]|uniref:hypothetical protein n=1 Tax=Flagellimonas onchidii TaxID=2562684 RepID=UPI0010A64506|nr:hypothetical protein [Allomuricauda onchidii]